MHLERQVRRILQLGMRDTARSRLGEYHHLFGPTGAYLALSFLCVIPPAWLVSIGRAKMRMAEWALSKRIARAKKGRVKAPVCSCHNGDLCG